MFAKLRQITGVLQIVGLGVKFLYIYRMRRRGRGRGDKGREMEGATDYDVLTDLVNTDILTCWCDKKEKHGRDGWPRRTGSPGLAKHLER